MISERTAVAVMSCCTVFCAHASMAPNPPHHNTHLLRSWFAQQSFTTDSWCWLQVPRDWKSVVKWVRI